MKNLDSTVPLVVFFEIRSRFTSGSIVCVCMVNIVQCNFRYRYIYLIEQWEILKWNTV